MKWFQQFYTDDKLSFKEQLDIVKAGLALGVRYDGCTGVPDFNFGADCCDEHDFHYQLLDMPRAEADRRLRECIRKKGYFFLPWIYWIGVRLFGARDYRKKQNETIVHLIVSNNADGVRDPSGPA
jgi:hypothetical protein